MIDKIKRYLEYKYYLRKAISTLIAENKELKEMLKHRIEYTNKLEKELLDYLKGE